MQRCKGKLLQFKSFRSKPLQLRCWTAFDALTEKGKSQNNKQLKWAILPAWVQKPSLTLFLFLRGQDAETEQLFPHFHKLQKTAFPECQYACALMLSSHRYWTDQTFSPSSSHCTSAAFSFMSKSQELVPSSEEFYHAGSAQQRRAVVTFSFTTWLYEREVHPVSSLGQVDKNRPSEVFQDITFPLTGKSVDKAVFLWWNVSNVKLFVNINDGSWQPTFKWIPAAWNWSLLTSMGVQRGLKDVE